MLDAETQKDLDELHASFAAPEMLCSKAQAAAARYVPYDPDFYLRQEGVEDEAELA